ncbi:MAG: IS3 family transposase [Alcaligenaceae bacterium]|nr:IS3 family transposase [Alcaligenaceae bacterium]
MSRSVERGNRITKACRFLGIARSTYYHAQHKTDAAQEDEHKAALIRQIHETSFFTFGRRRIGEVLEAATGLKLGESQLGRLMRQFDLQARIRQPRRPGNGYRGGKPSGLPGNILNRQFHAEHPGERFLTDVTYVRYYEQQEWHWGYLSVVLDLFDRSVVAWVYSKQQDLKLALNTLKVLSFKEVRQGAILHSDHGSMYTSHAFRDELKRLGIQQSLSRVGNCHDNAPMESFNGTLKVEGLRNPAFGIHATPSFLEQNQAIERYIEFYNHQRPSSILKNKTPMAFRGRYYDQLAAAN